MIRATTLAAVLFMTNPVQAAPVDDVLRLWASQAGTWVGSIDIYSSSDAEPLTITLKTIWSSTPDQKIPVKIETFKRPQGSVSSVTLMMAEDEMPGIVTPYFANGSQKDYRFSIVEVSESDKTNWTTVIASPDGSEVYEDRPAVLRYVRTRSGNTIENTKEVNFLDDGNEVFELRSFIRQTLISK